MTSTAISEALEKLPPVPAIEDVAAALGLPKASLRAAAEEHGYLVRVGRAVRMDKGRIQELIDKCRVQPKEQGSTNTSTRHTGTSQTQGKPHAARAAQAAKMLKKPSRHISQQKAAPVLPMTRTT